MKVRARAPRIFTATVNTDGYAEGELTDWPREMQDLVQSAKVRMELKTGINLEIIGSRCLRDADDMPYYCVITCAEILGPNDVVIEH